MIGKQFKQVILYASSFSKVMVVCTCLYTAATAQEKRYFNASGKNIRIDSMNKQVETMLEETGIPGLSFAVIGNNEVSYYNTYGYKKLSTKDKADKQTVFEAASLSKSFLVYAAFKLVDEGKLDLDRPMYKYLDPGPQLSNNPRYKLVTPRMILSHCSGIENWQRYNNPDSLEIVSEPGKSYVYSGTGYNLLADVIQLITGKPYAEYINEMVIVPLKLKNSYLRFIETGPDSSKKIIPGNYATGHDDFGNELNKWKHNETVPASGNNTTAEDYARLIIAIFDGKHLSQKSINTILEPVIKTSEGELPGYYGTGFEIYYLDGDTLIAHGGDNSGFKGQLFYSVAKKSGFVFFSNSENGKLLTSRLSELSAGIDVRGLYKRHYPDQYPSNAIVLLKTYRLKGADSTWLQLQQLKDNNQLEESDLFSLGWYLIDHNRELAQKIFEENLILYPLSATTHGFLGELFYKKRKYDLACRNFIVAKELNFQWWNLDNKIKECTDKIADAGRRRSNLAKINGQEETRLNATDYNYMEGIDVGPVEDVDGKQLIVYLGTGSWIEFKTFVNEPGIYSVSFRVSSLRGGNELQVWRKDKMLTSIKIPSTKSWKSWITLTVPVELVAGMQSLRLTSALQGNGFDVRWMSFLPVQNNKDTRQTIGQVDKTN